MKRSNFIGIIIASSVFFVFISGIDKLFVHDLDLELIYESVLLTIVLATIGIVAAKYYGDDTANQVIKEVKKMILDVEQRLDNLESESKSDKKTND